MHTTIYIKEDNREKWKQIQNKSQYVNDCLDGSEDDLERKMRRIMKDLIPEVIAELQGL